MVISESITLFETFELYLNYEPQAAAPQGTATSQAKGRSHPLNSLFWTNRRRLVRKRISPALRDGLVDRPILGTDPSW